MKKLSVLTLSLAFLSMPALAGNNDFAKNNSYETVKVLKVDRTSKPHKHSIQTIRVTDVASLELEDSKGTPANSKLRAAFNHKKRL